MKKLFAVITTVSMAVMFAGPVGAVTIQELLDQIALLQAQLLTLQGASSGVPTACAGITSFTVNLSQGSSGANVKCLQALLNTSADTKVAASGVGSAGSETTYFGSLTKAAVMAFQAKKAISPVAGFVGPLTRAALNTMLTAPAVSPTPGVTPGVTPTPSTAPSEGSYTVALSATPVSRTVTGGAGIEAYGINVTAYNSDITVGRIDLQARVVDVNAVAQSPSTFITKVRIYDTSVSDANLKATYTDPVFSLDTAGLYYAQLTGMNVVVTKGTTKKVLLVIDTVSSADLNRTVTLNVYGNGIRGTDTIGLSTYAALATVRVLTVRPSGIATLTMSLATVNPTSTNMYCSATDGVATDTTVLAFNAKATVGDATLTRLEVIYASAGASQAIPSVLALYSGDSVADTCTPNARENGVCTFETLRLPIVKDETKSMYIKAQFAVLAQSGDNAFTATIPATSTHSVYERSNGSVQQTTIAVPGLVSNPMFLFEQGVKMTFVSGTNTVTTNALGHGTATGTLKFTVQPFGGTLTAFVAAVNATGTVNQVAVRGQVGADLNYATGATYALTVNPPANVTDGSSAEVTVTTTATDDGTTNVGLMRFKIEDVFWTVGAITADQFNGPTSGNMIDTWVTNFANLE